MSGISSAVPMLSQMTSAQQSLLTQQLQQLLNAGNAANNALKSSILQNEQNSVKETASQKTAADTLTLSPAALSLQQLTLQHLPLQQLLNAEMPNGEQSGESAGSESGLTELAQLKSQGELAATLINAKLQKGTAAPAHKIHTQQNYAQQYARQSDIHSASRSPANVHFVRHIIEGKMK